MSSVERTPQETYLQLLAVGSTVLGQALTLLANTVINEEQLTYTSKHIPGSTIGKHLRHVLDHYTLLLDALETSHPEDSVELREEHLELNYDERKRNTPVETSRDAAKKAYETIIARLEAFGGLKGGSVPQLTLPVFLAADTPHHVTVKSSLGRELWFCALHAIHHYSMIRVICGELELATDNDFGFAPSTLKFHQLQDKAKI
ncbi:hypothetical protein BKA62DRAFT_693820 [Auriculariales sp. MPI-PUGE-AT-0066]|nr:hypothetical protein BKA62DRAFT_693820 [Auriculariales sp. MPI-PUGE-AT-0066]